MTKRSSLAVDQFSHISFSLLISFRASNHKILLLQNYSAREEIYFASSILHIIGQYVVKYGACTYSRKQSNTISRLGYHPASIYPSEVIDRLSIHWDESGYLAAQQQDLDPSDMSGSKMKSALPQSTTSTSANFFSLPIEIRNHIYKQVLAVPLPLYLFQDTGPRVEVFAPEKPYRWLALLYTNRQISDEVSAILYGENKFTLEEVGSLQHQGKLLKSFLDCIGSVNTGFLSHLCITFPALERVDGRPREIRLTKNTVQNLQLLKKGGSKLRTLEMLVYGKGCSDLFREDLNNNRYLREAFMEIDTQLRGIDSLQNIIVRISSGSPAPSVREFLQELGWVVFPGSS